MDGLYHLEFSLKARQDLQDLPPLSREGRNKLFANLAYLREVSDEYRADTTNRVGEELRYSITLRDSGRVRQFIFAVDDSGAPAGVLRILGVVDPASQA